MPSGHDTSPAQVTGAKKTVFRPDIQGLRAIAVIAVILNHTFGWPVGGFVGVDIFFVISGFLITGLLIRERERVGRISFVEFYRRRVKRILPMSTLVILVTTAASFSLYLSARAQSVFTDGVWALLFAANWRLAYEGTDYWAADGTVSPLQHYWSLAVEEQFYFVWPWIIVLIYGLAATRWWRSAKPRVALFAIMSVVTIASLLWAITHTNLDPTFAYFSTFVRAWELGAGAMIAIAAPLLSAIPRWLRPVLGWFGLTGIATSLFITPESPGFPAPWALLSVGATAMVIIAGTGGEQRLMAPLTNPASRYLGDISYSLYLWHFPVIVLLSALMPRSPAYYAITLSGTLLLSVLSYHLVEDGSAARIGDRG